jgi:hypothetical protein
MARTYRQLNMDERRTLFRLVEARRPVGEIAVPVPQAMHRSYHVPPRASPWQPNTPVIEEAAGVLRRQPVDDVQQAFRRLGRGADLKARLRERRR